MQIGFLSHSNVGANKNTCLFIFQSVCLKPVCKFSLKFSYSSTVFGDLISTNWFHLNESSPHPMSHFYSIPRKQISNREKVIFYFRSGYRSRIWKIFWETLPVWCIVFPATYFQYPAGGLSTVLTFSGAKMKFRGLEF